MTDPQPPNGSDEPHDAGMDLFVPRSDGSSRTSVSEMSAGGVTGPEGPTQSAPDPSSPDAPDAPRPISRRATGIDRTFELSTMAVGAFVLVITGAIGVFLAYQAVPTFRHYGWGFLTGKVFDPSVDEVGILSAIGGTLEVAVIALVVAFPLALTTALYVTQYAPPKVRSAMTSVIDLMAAIPSIIVGAFGLFVLAPQIGHFARWLSTWLGWIPIFTVPDADPRSPTTQEYHYEGSAFVVGCVVAIMVIPLAASVMINVFGQTPPGEKEGAFALGSTRWGMIRAVVLPFGRGGIIGGTMLGLGRALGETIAVLIVGSVSFDLKIHVLSNGTLTISSLIANNFGDATPNELAALLAAGFVLFLMTLVVNTFASIIVSRGRSGAGVDV